MAGRMGIILAFLPVAEAGNAAILPQRGKLIATTGKYLVRIALMADIPDDLVPGQIQTEMQRHGQFHHSQVGSQMPSCPADLLNKEGAYLFRKLFILFRRNLLDIIRLIDFSRTMVPPPLSVPVYQ